MTTTEISSERLEVLADWLEKRSQPDSGIRYEGAPNFGRGARVELHGPDATFIASNFHGEGASILAAELRSVLSELRDRRAAGGEAVAWRTEYRDVYQGKDTGWHFRYTDHKPNPAPLTPDGCGHRNVTPLYLHPSNSGVAVKALQLVIDAAQSILSDLGPGGYLVPAGAVKTNRLVSAIREARAALHPSPDAGTSQAVPLIDSMSEEEFNRDRSDENPNVGRKDPEGTWSDAGKERTPDEISFKAGWDKAKQLLKPEDLESFVTADKMVDLKARIIDALEMSIPHSFELDAESGGYYDTDLSRELRSLIAALKVSPE